MTGHSEDGHSMRVRHIEAKVVGGRIPQMLICVPRKFWFPIRGCSETNLARLDVKISAQTLPQQGSADDKLIARLWKLEARRPLSLVRIEKLEQSASLFLPRKLVNLPDVNFIVRQEAIETQQRF